MQNQDKNKLFLENYLDAEMGLKPARWLDSLLSQKAMVTIVDVRDESKYLAGHIEDSINIPLQLLPELAAVYLPDKKSQIVCVCSGSVQSAYAIMYLYSCGYQNVSNLSGGFSGWQKFQNEKNI